MEHARHSSSDPDHRNAPPPPPQGIFEGTSKGKDTRTEPTDMVLGVAPPPPPPPAPGGGGEYWNYSGLQIGLLPEQEGKF